MEIRVCILRIEGTNCEYETCLAFRRLGAKSDMIHLKQLSKKRNLFDYHCLIIPGGFSAGDYIRAGAIFAARIKSSLWNQLKDFVDLGFPVGGICNGFQVLVELGLLPGSGMRAALCTNDSGRFECRPTLLKHENRGKCIFTRLIPEEKILLVPCAHAEGKFIFPAGKEEEYLKKLINNDQIVFRYVDSDGNYASYPWNPNGSFYNIAGICNSKGNVFGVMPHPERVFYGDGRVIFESVLSYIKEELL